MKSLRYTLDRIFRIHNLFNRLIGFGLVLLVSQSAQAQVIDTLSINDTTANILFADSLIQRPDSLIIAADTLMQVTSEGMLKDPVHYSAHDSIRFDLKGQMVYLFHQNELSYEQINLKANYVEIDFLKKTVYARGVPDTLGVIQGNPVFSESGQQFRSKEMRYSFETRKGIIKQVITQEGDGYLHGAVIKKMPDDVINIRHGKYTTCNLDHPHFEFRFSRSKVIPNNKIVTGPAFLVIEDVPLPLALPFGLFPNKKGQRSGLLLPSYGESRERGFYFENFGYYWGINEYLDLELRGDIYTRGTWAIKTKTGYNKRYKYNGSLGLSYARNIIGEEGSPDYDSSRDFAILWNHRQSDKARPNSRFSADVNVKSSKFNKFNPVSTSDYLSNTFQSSISYQTSWEGKYFLTSGLTHSQNVITKAFDLTLPQLNFSVSRFHPFRNATRVGKKRWYDDISVSYTMEARNQLNTYDSLLFTSEIWDQFQNGIRHNIPIQSTIKVLKHFNLTNSINYTERWYTRKIERHWSTDTVIVGNDTIAGRLVRDTLGGFYAVRDVSFSSNLSTKLYGMMQFRKGPIRAVRHVLSPSIVFSYVPDYGTESVGYYDTYVDGAGRTQKYSLYEGAFYGTPSNGKSGRLTFSISNNLEMKVKSKKDTISGLRKVVLIENLTLSSAYDLARDSLNWSYLTINGRTKLIKNIDIVFNSSWDPYILDSTGSRNLNQFEWNKNRKLVRFRNADWNISLNWRFNDQVLAQTKQSDKGSQEELDQINRNLDNYVDFNVPWNLNFSYTLNYRTSMNPKENKVEKNTIQTLNINGDVNLTPKWKVGFSSGYDFINKDFSHASIDIYRDLHCWEMRFNWIPIGWRTSWNFTINVKSSMLQDLKLNKKKDFRDF